MWKGSSHMTKCVSINLFAMLQTILFDLIIAHASLIQSVHHLDHTFPLHDHKWESIYFHSKYMGIPSPKQHA